VRDAYSITLFLFFKPDASDLGF